MSKVLLLFGGNSSEHEISCKSIINVIKNIDTNLFEYKTVGITKDGRWIECNLENIINNDWYNLTEIENIIKYLKQFDLVFPVMHGAGGEDGKLGGMLELFNIDYVGSKMEASAIGMNKYLSKIFFDSSKSFPFSNSYTSTAILLDCLYSIMSVFNSVLNDESSSHIATVIVFHSLKYTLHSNFYIKVPFFEF